MTAAPVSTAIPPGKAHNADAPAACTVVITTKNRKEELAGAIESSLRQTAPLQVLVIDDASTDGTGDLVRDRFGHILYERAPMSSGYIIQRNRAARMASTPIIVSIDDDAAFPSPRTIEQTLAEFDHPRIGAVAIPYINILTENHVIQRAPGPGPTYLSHTYTGTAHALRRDVFLRLGGYREEHFHQGEEDDYCIRMLAAGYVVRAGLADPIHHFESPNRDLTRFFRYNARNHILHMWHNVPMPDMPLRMAVVTLNLLKIGFKKRHVRDTLWGLRTGYAELFAGHLKRRPISRPAYRLFRRILKQGPVTLDQVEGMLPPLSG